MNPSWKTENIQLYHNDCLVVLPHIETVNLVFVDPPYNIGIFKKMSHADYLEWCEQWIKACDSALIHNGAFWVSHKHPNVLVDISRMIEGLGRNRINWITWDKYNGTGSQKGFLDGHTVISELKSFQVMAEYLAYHADEEQWNNQCDDTKGFIFESIRTYLDGERKRAKISDTEKRQYLGISLKGGGLLSHYWGYSQWIFPTKERYEQLRNCFEAKKPNDKFLPKKYEDLRKEYEDLQKEYEHLRYTFNNPGLVSSIWQIPPAPKNGHPTPKPLKLMERIIATTTNFDDIVLDPMMGSGTTAIACLKLGRKFIGIEQEKKWFDLAQSLIEKELTKTQQLELDLTNL